MKITTFILAACIIFFSCKKNVSTVNAEIIPEMQVRNDRIVFKDRPSFERKANEFDEKGLKTSKEFKSQFPSFKSLGEALEIAPEVDGLREFNFPHYLLSILNPLGEFQIGDTIIAYLGGYKYYIPGENETALNKLRTDNSFAESYPLRTREGYLPVTIRENTTELQKVNMPLGSNVDARHQLQFWAYAPAAGWRKYVHEIQSYYESWIAPGCNGIQWRSRLYLRMKMEWKGSRWRPAGETRDINWAVDGTVDVMHNGINGTVIASYPISSTGNVTQNFDQEIRLLLLDQQTICTPNLSLNVTINGTIYQHIVGDIQSNEWYNTGTPLW